MPVPFLKGTHPKAILHNLTALLKAGHSLPKARKIAAHLAKVPRAKAKKK
jgi:hypothetical protein